MTEVLPADEAVRAVGAGSCVGVGGALNTGHPMALVRALIRAGVRELTATGLTSGLEMDLLVAAGMVRTLSAAFVGAEDVAGLPPAIRWAAETGTLRIRESEEGLHLASLRARALRLPYSTWVGGVGTAVATNPLVEQAVDEVTGATFLKVRPMRVDVAFVWAEAADHDGNIVLMGPDLGDVELLNAADHRIVQVERIVPTAVLAHYRDRVVPAAADVVVRAPLSTHPFAGARLDIDDAWLARYVEAVASARHDQDPAAVQEFVDGWVRDLDGEDAYLERVGVARLRELMC